MSVIHYPVLVWGDGQGGSTAALVGDAENAAAHAGTVKEALAQLKELLEWRGENEPWNVEPDLTQPQLIEVKVDVLPQYSERKRIIPCPETVWLKVPCVIGVQENGLKVCVVPHLGLRFNYQEAAELKSLAAHYIKEELKGLSPLELAGRLPPRGCRLEEVVLRRTALRRRRPPPVDRPELKILFAVADPLLHAQGRKRVHSAAYGREDQSAVLARKLGHEKANVLLVGESGVGKSTLLLDAAKRLLREKPASGKAGEEGSENDLRSYRFWRGNGGRMIEGMRYLGEWEERCEAFLGQLNAMEGIFCAENLLELLQVGGQGPGSSVAAFLLPYLQRGELRMVAEATPAEVAACGRLLPGLLDVFQVLPVPEFNDGQAVEVLGRVASACAEAHRLKVEPGVVPLVRKLFKRFLPYAAFPGPAAGFVRMLCERRGRNSAKDRPHPGPMASQAHHESVSREETFASRKVVPRERGQLSERQEGRASSGRSLHEDFEQPKGSGGTQEQAVTVGDVVAQFVQQTGLPEIFLRDDQPLALEEVRAKFEAQIIGQAEATLAAARLVTTIKVGLTDPGRPFGVLLFCGPTGVGKTALAKAVAEFCFGATGQKDRLVRLDMSEYSGWGAAGRLLQSGNDARGGAGAAPWIEKVRRQPFCVLLFDEIEKAAPEVFDVLLGLLDEGRLTDRFGNVTNFRSAIIILTSNLGSTVGGRAGFRADEGPDYESEVGKFFRPEFFNRLDGVITFKPLTPAEVELITRKELADLAAREGFVAAGIQLEWSEVLVQALAREGYDHRLGARPLQRAIERLVVTPLARWKVENPGVRDARVRVEVGENNEVKVNHRGTEAQR